jgi:hypothetical protein
VKISGESSARDVPGCLTAKFSPLLVCHRGAQDLTRHMTCWLSMAKPLVAGWGGN